MKRNVCRFMAAGIAFAILSGCGGGSGDNGGPDPAATTTSFEATIAGAGRESGKLSVTIQAQVAAAVSLPTGAAVTDTVAASGTLVLVGGGGTISLAGTFNPANRGLSLSGGGYAFVGSIDAGLLNGAYTSPGGRGGTFTGLDASAGAASVYCGTYSGVRFSGGPLGGLFNIVVSSKGTISGIAHDDQGVTSSVSGTLSGNSISLTSSGGAVIRGTRSGDTVSGTFSDRNSSGTWEGRRV